MLRVMQPTTSKRVREDGDEMGIVRPFPLTQRLSRFEKIDAWKWLHAVAHTLNVQVGWVGFRLNRVGHCQSCLAFEPEGFRSSFRWQ
jgi:hypothetical protein